MQIVDNQTRIIHAIIFNYQIDLIRRITCFYSKNAHKICIDDSRTIIALDD